MLALNQADYDLAVHVIQTTCTTTKDSAIIALDRINEILRRRVDINKIETSVLRDAFP
jgi:hypothetical protein